MRNEVRKPSSTFFVLRSLIPYSREGTLLAVNPHKYFNELERLSGQKRKTLQSALYRAEKKNLIKREGALLTLTDQGLRYLEPFIAAKLENSRLMVIFDIPEQRAAARQRLRNILKEWRFEQVQKSVWISDFDCRSTLMEVLGELELKAHVQVFECSCLYPETDK